MFVDIHAHLDFPEILRKKDELVNGLKSNKILVYSNTLNLSNYLETKSLYSDVENVIVIPGFYPVNVENSTKDEREKFFQYFLEHKKEFDAIGEVGLDLKEGKNIELQKSFLRDVLLFAVNNNKAVIMHTRKAEAEALDIIEKYVKNYNFKKIDLHCFTGKKKFYEKIKELKIFVSIPLIVLTSEQFQNLVKFIPTSQLLVETDSPFLHPEKEINTSLNIPLIYKKIAELKGLDEKEVENIIYNNYMRFIK